ncbi:hypothetical protein CDL12_13233 [Handroanthus impetiginosus]|uniref:Uncharacterized protein n=1 Tax=Handroanthus impetiginosus TaxID=429701 RepID=A0A2G9H9C1_9LAMI|nr:hypothetical protein CDL12_13233 [Handroanthus impetiginosus]
MEKFSDFDAYRDIKLLRESTDFDVREKKKLLDENVNIDESVKKLLSNLLDMEERVDSHQKQKEKDDDREHDNDPSDDGNDQEPREKRRERENDLCEHCSDFYNDDNDDDEDENDPHSDDECNQEPRRKLRSAMKQNNAPSSHQMPGVDNQAKIDSLSTSIKETINLTQRKSMNNNSEKAQNVKCSTNEMVPDPDYLIFTQALEVVGDHYVFTYEGYRVVYEMNGGESSQERKENHDESSSDVEIIDRTSFCKKGNVNPSLMNGDSILNCSSRTMQSEFRHQVITLLRKPFNKDEYDKLWSEVKLRKLENRHMDLRNGRERSCSTQKIGKSYLDYYPDLRRRLRHFQDDKPKRLNILRGFFFWLQNLLQNGSFRPWEDAECLAVNPGSC